MKQPPVINDLFSPARILVNSEGDGETTKRAREMYGITADVIFHRDDGWCLAAPFYLGDVAYKMWSDCWTHFVERPDKEWRPISEWKGVMAP